MNTSWLKPLSSGPVSPTAVPVCLAIRRKEDKRDRARISSRVDINMYCWRFKVIHFDSVARIASRLHELAVRGMTRMPLFAKKPDRSDILKAHSMPCNRSLLEPNSNAQLIVDTKCDSKASVL